MKLRNAIVVLYCIMVVVMPIFTSMLRIPFLPLYRLANEGALFDWVKLYYFATVIGALYLISLFVPGEKKVQFNRSDVPIALFLLLGLVMLFLDSHRYDSSRRMRELIAGFTLYFVAKNVFIEARHKKALLISLASSIGFVSLLGIIHYFISFNSAIASKFILPPISPDSVPWEAGFGIRATSTLGNPNFLADILIFVIPVWIGAVIFVKKDAPAGWMAVLAVATFLLLLFTNSWGGYIGVIASSAIMILLTILKKPKTKYKGMVFVVIALCLLSTAIFFGIKKGEAFGKGKTGEEELVGVESRKILWESAWQMVFPDREQFPEASRWRWLTGWGLDNFFTYSNLFLSKFSTADRYQKLWEARPGFITRNPGRPHNEFLTLIVELGIPGLILFLLIFVYYIRDLLKEWKPNRAITNDIFIFGVIGGIFAVWAQSLVSYPFRLGIAWMIICTGMGVALQGVKWRTREFTVRSGSMKILSAPVIALALFLLYQNTIGAVCLCKYQSAMERFTNDPRSPSFDSGKILSYPDDKVIDNLFYCADHWHRDHETYFALSLYLLYHNRLDEADKILVKLEYIQPYHEKTHFFRGEYWRKKGDYDKAIETYHRAITYEPRYIPPRILLVESFLKMGKLDDAQKEIDAALIYENEAHARLAKKKVEAKALEERKETDSKLEGQKVNVYPEDLLFYWLHSAQATLYAVKGNRMDAEKELKIAWDSLLEYIGVSGFTTYSFHASLPIIGLNRDAIEYINGRTPPENISEWTKLFYGASEWNEYDSLDRHHENSFIAGKALAQTNPSASAKHFRKALDMLEEIARKFPTRFVTSDGMMSRETYNRMGVLYLQMNPPDFGKAIQSFERSRDNGGDINIANYNILLTQMILRNDERALSIPMFNAGAERKTKTLEAQALFYQNNQNYRDAGNLYMQILETYPLYAPAIINLANSSIVLGETQRAKAIVTQALELFPTHPKIIEQARQLGIPLPQN